MISCHGLSFVFLDSRWPLENMRSREPWEGDPSLWMHGGEGPGEGRSERGIGGGLGVHDELAGRLQRALGQVGAGDRAHGGLLEGPGSSATVASAGCAARPVTPALSPERA